MTKYNEKLISDKDVFSNQLFKMLDLKMKLSLNLYEYVELRKSNFAYNVCLKQDEEFSYKNFPVAIHMVIKGMY